MGRYVIGGDGFSCDLNIGEAQGLLRERKERDVGIMWE
jgi:hypothetical protein